MKNGKRILSLLLALVMLLSLFPATAFAEWDEPADEPVEDGALEEPADEPEVPPEEPAEEPVRDGAPGVPLDDPDVPSEEPEALPPDDGEIGIEAVSISSTNFPDANFRSYVSTFDKDGNGSLSDSELAAVTSISCNGRSISNLKGIQYFTSITSLNCGSNQLTALDVSKNTALTTLSCSNNQLTALNLSKNTALVTLYCSSNQLRALDVSGCTALEWLNCYSNQLTALDVSGCPALERLDCYSNQLAALDVSANTALTQLYCNNNRLTALDLSANTALERLDCRGNTLNTLDLSANTALERLYCNGNSLSSLVLNSALNTLSCTGNELAALDLSACPELKQLNCSGNSALTELDLRRCPTLKELTEGERKEYSSAVWYYGNSSFLYVNNRCRTGNDKPGLLYNKTTELVTSEGEGVPIDEEHFPDANFRAAIREFDTDRNGYLSDAEIAEATGLGCAGESIASLAGVEYFTALSYLDCAHNQLTSLDLSRNTALRMLDCSNNQLTSLDVSSNAALATLICSNNALTSLDVSSNTELATLSCYNNQLTSLDVSSNTALTALSCYNNQLASLDVSGCSALKRIWCYNNRLTGLDLSGCGALTKLYCYYNSIAALDLHACPTLAEAARGGFETRPNFPDTVRFYGGTTLVVDETMKLITEDPPVPTGIPIDAEHFPDANFRALVSGFDTDGNTYLSDEEIAAVTSINCYNRGIASLQGIGCFTALTTLNCRANALTELDLSANPALTMLWCYGNEIAELDLRPCPTLAEAAEGERIKRSGYPDTVSFFGEYEDEWGNLYYRLAVDDATKLISRDPPPHIPGDANGDGEIDGLDAVRLRKYLSGQEVEINLLNADVTGDGKVDGRDFIRLMKYLAGQNVELR